MNALWLLDEHDEPIPFALTPAGELAPASTSPASLLEDLDGETWDRVIALRAVCACGVDQGDHDADAPHACADTGCAGFVEASGPESGRAP